MSKTRNKPKPRTSVETAMSTPSAILRSAATQTGGGSHGGSVKANHKRSRAASNQALKRGDWNA